MKQMLLALLALGQALGGHSGLATTHQSYLRTRFGQEDAKSVFKTVASSVYTIVANDSNSKPEAMGTGFAVTDHLIATNFHVIQNSFSLTVSSSQTHQELKVEGIKGIDRDNDLALIQVSDMLQPLEIKRTSTEVGETIYAVGNPRGLEESLSSGLISGIRDSSGTTLYQISAPISPGSSGGPVLTAKPEVVGVATSYLEDGQNLNFAVSGQHLLSLLAAASLQTPTPVDKCSGGSLTHERKPAAQAVTITSPAWEGNYDVVAKSDGGDLLFDDDRTTYKMVFNLSVDNESDKRITSVDLQMVFFDTDGKDMIDAERKTLTVSVDPHLAKRLQFTTADLHFNTLGCSNWRISFRVLNFDVQN